jgi:DNA-binding NarL/FixJ family response regulator
VDGDRCAGVAGHTVAASAPEVALVRIPDRSPDAALAAASLLSQHHRVPVVVWGEEFRACLAKRLGGLCPRGVLVEPLHTQQLLATLTVAACIGVEAAEDGAASPAAMRGVLERIRDLLGSVGVTHGAVPPGEGPDLSVLTRREREVLEAFVRLRRIPDVAESLFISKHTVRNHLKSIYSKLGVHSQPELMVLMLSGRS